MLKIKSIKRCVNINYEGVNTLKMYIGD